MARAAGFFPGYYLGFFTVGERRRGRARWRVSPCGSEALLCGGTAAQPQALLHLPPPLSLLVSSPPPLPPPATAFIQSGIKRVIAALGGGKRGGPPPSIPSKFLQWLLTMFVLDYALSAFCLLDAPRGLLVWRSLFFMGHVLGAVLVALGAGLEAAAPRKPKAAAAAPAAAEGATGKGKAA